MANVYHKMLKKSTSKDYKENIIAGLQKELSDSAHTLNIDLFDITKSITTRRSKLDVESLLKYYVINQLLKDIPGNQPNSIVEKQYELTANKNYRKDPSTNQYYRLSGEKWVLDETITLVNDDGSYVVSEKRPNSSFVYKKEYDENDSLQNIQIIDSNGKVVSNRTQVIAMLGLRKEVARKYKYSGYSGESNDVVAALLNKISSARETGYYMDQNYNLFWWNQGQKCFVRNNDELDISPLLVDYIFENNSSIVIRKEYTGIK